MTKEEEKAVQEDNHYFIDESHENQVKDLIWFISVSAICITILIGIWLIEVYAL